MFCYDMTEGPGAAVSGEQTSAALLWGHPLEEQDCVPLDPLVGPLRSCCVLGMIICISPAFVRFTW